MNRDPPVELSYFGLATDLEILYGRDPDEKGNPVNQHDIEDKTGLSEVGGHAEHLEIGYSTGTYSYGWEDRIDALRKDVQKRLTDLDKRVERMSDDILRRAKSAIATRDRWVQHALCVTESESGTRPNSPQAARWCALGATYKGAGSLGLGGTPEGQADTIAALILAQHRLAQVASRRYGQGTSVVDVNDNRGDRSFELVHWMFDKALDDKETTDEEAAES